jgi:hypothetical protein
MKTCICCKTDKTIEFFGKNKNTKDGLNCYCKECSRKKNLKNEEKYRKKNPEQRKELTIQWREKNPEKHKQTISEYAKKNSKQIKQYQKEYNPIRNQTNKERRQKDPLYKLKQNTRSRVSVYLSRSGEKTIKLIGCSYDFLKEHLEKQFISGMTWENYGYYGWHVDHKIPLASAKTKEELIKLCHYTNLQPLWMDENLSKGAKII